jgi:hypothetical protein
MQRDVSTEDEVVEEKKQKTNSVARELYRPRGRRLSTKSVSTLADRGCRLVSATDPYGTGFCDRGDERSGCYNWTTSTN